MAPRPQQISPAPGPLAAVWGDLSPQRFGELLAPGGLLPRATPPGAGSRTGRGERDDAVQTLVAQARAECGTPWPQPLASTWSQVRRTGNRTNHEELVFAHTHRTTRAVLAAASTSESEELLDEVADAVLLRCEQTSWCWPAHDDTHSRNGFHVPDPDRPSLDLGAGEVAGQFAWLDHLIGDRLDRRWPGLRERVRREVRSRVLEPFVQRRNWHWLGLDGDVHNWNPWIHGNVLAAAFALLDDPTEEEFRAEVVALAVQGIDRYVAALPEDGGVDEGFDYWFNGACRALEALELVASATGGVLDWTSLESLRATVGFPPAMHLAGQWHAAFADARARVAEGLPWHALHAAARRAGDLDAAAYAAALAREVARRGDPVLDARAGLGRLVGELADDTWWTARAVDAPAPLPAHTWLPSLQILVARPGDFGRSGTSVAVKGGHDHEHHNHCDVGSVVVAVNGVPVVVDPGRPTYTAQTFGPRRYELWPMGSSWHSVPQPGADQRPGREQAARGVQVRHEPHATQMTLDLANAYPGSGLSSWHRTVRLDRVRDEVDLTDAWVFGHAVPAGVNAVHLVLAGGVQLETGLARVDLLDGSGTALLRWNPADVVEVSLQVRELDDPMLTHVWGERLTRLRLELPGTTTGTVRVRVGPGRAVPAGADGSALRRGAAGLPGCSPEPR